MNALVMIYEWQMLKKNLKNNATFDKKLIPN
jgi:hypothetical protein